MSNIGILNTMSKIGNVMSKAKGNIGQLGKIISNVANNKIAQLSAIRQSAINKVTQSFGKGEPDLTDIDIEFYIREACMDLVPTKYEGTMIGLRVKYTLDSQLYGLAQTIAGYIDIDPTELYDAGANFNSDIDDIISAIYDIVESEIDYMGDQETICKNFWNNRELV